MYYIFNIIETKQHSPSKTIRKSSYAAYIYLFNVNRMPKRNFRKDITFSKSTMPQYTEHGTISWATDRSDSHQLRNAEVQSVSYKPQKHRNNQSQNQTVASMNDIQNHSDIDTNYISKKDRILGSKSKSKTKKNNNDLVVVEVPTR
jgi:hypothetical protein